LLGSLLGAFVTSSAYAWDVYPNVTYETPNGSFNCSLRVAVLSANAGIDMFPCHLTGSDTGNNVVHLKSATYTLSNSPLYVGDTSGAATVTIQGNGAGATKVQGGSWRVQGTVDYESLTLDRSRVQVDPNRSLYMNNCVAQNSSSADAGGAFRFNGDPSGGSAGFFTNTWFKDNSSFSGGAIYTEHGSYISVSNSTFSGNVATSQFGGAVHVTGQSYFSNTTFSGNVAEMAGGALYLATTGSELDYCTVTNNDIRNNAFNFATNAGGGMHVSGQVYLYGTILSGNKYVGVANNNCRTQGPSAVITSLGGNLFGNINGPATNPCLVTTQSNDRMSSTPDIGALGSAAGPAPVSAPAHYPCRYSGCFTSGANGNTIDAFGGAASCIFKDQVGSCRNVLKISGVSDHQDIGSVERQ
jgi:predicted outer membrane repeat protein